MKKLEKVYYDPSHPASFSGAQRLAKATGIPLSRVKEWLKEQRAYTLHKPLKKKFRRSPTVVAGIDHQWQADLSDVSSIAGDNDGYTFLLCVIDVFSKYAWVIPLSNKTGKSLVEAFKTIKKRQPLRLQTDKGKEFLNKTFQAYLKERGIHFFVTHNVETKASVVERFQRTLKQRMWRYFTHKRTQRYVDVLPKLVKAYNSAHHRTIGMAPKDVKEEHEWKLTKRIQGVNKKKKKISFGPKVRLALAKQTAFDKGYWPNWTLETFLVRPHVGSRYKLVDGNGDPLEGSFYPEELQSVREAKDEVWPIEKVLETKGKNIKVRWQGYPSSFDSWIPKSSLTKTINSRKKNRK